VSGREVAADRTMKSVVSSLHCMGMTPAGGSHGNPPPMARIHVHALWRAGSQLARWVSRVVRLAIKKGDVMTNVPTMTRRDTLVFSAAALTTVLIPIAEAGESPERHGISAFGDLKYPANFQQFDYVNPEAPKGGTFSHVSPTRIFNQGLLTFNSLNSFILKGDAAQGMEFTFASLMARAQDEPDAMYGLAARAVQVMSDRLAYHFLMRPGITFHDGSPLTAHDVAFSLQLLKEKGIRSFSNCFTILLAPRHPMTVPWW
jgi:hypothetical protein